MFCVSFPRAQTVWLQDVAPFLTQFLPSLAATLVGVFAGVLLALLVERRRDQRARNGREAALLRAARGAVQENLEICTGLRPVLERGAFPLPMIVMDVGLLDAILPRLAEMSPDTALLADLNGFRYELHHVNRRLDHILELSRLPITNRDEMLLGFGGSILMTMPKMEALGQRLRELSEGRITSLEAPPRGWAKLLSRFGL